MSYNKIPKTDNIILTDGEIEIIELMDLLLQSLKKGHSQVILKSSSEYYDGENESGTKGWVSQAELITE